MRKKVIANWWLIIAMHFALFVSFIPIRLFEYFMLSPEQKVSGNFIKLFLKIAVLDGFTALLPSFLFLIPFLFLNKSGKNYFAKGYIFILLIILFFDIALTQFFLTTNTLLGNTMTDFSLNEFWHIIKNEFVLSRWKYWLLYIFLLPALYIFLKKIIRISIIKNKIKYIVIGFHLASIFVFFLTGKKYYLPSSHFETSQQYMVSNNKVAALIHSYFIKIKKDKTAFNNFELYASDYKESTDGIKINDDEYPLMYETEYANVLGDYFPVCDTPPNIVFIFGESLSGSICGDRSRYPHIMPFFDSLQNFSLYFPRLLSNAPQTYGVLPNVLGSLPLGLDGRGLMNINMIYPKHQTILSLLSSQNYQSAFFVGCDSHFDNMDNFLKGNKIGNIVDIRSFDEKTQTAMKGKWGIDDKEMFTKSFEIFKKYNSQKPFVNIHLTLSYHSPFSDCPASYRTAEYVNSRLKKYNIIRDEKLNWEGENIIGSIFFVNDSYSEFFDLYKKKKEFNNTIFIITGDHGATLQRSMTERFNIPLYIYSPMLKKAKRFPAVSTQRDIIPSLIALLENNFHLSFPKEKHWLGGGLDTASTYRCAKSCMMALYDDIYPHFLYKDYILMADKVYKIDSNFMEIQIENKALFSKLKKYEAASVALCKYSIGKNKILK